MKVTEKDVLYVADLANLELTEAERMRMVRDLNQILEHIDMLNELDTSNAAPMAQISDQLGGDAAPDSARFLYAMRADQTRPCLPREEALKNAPESDGSFFKVPKVIER